MCCQAYPSQTTNRDVNFWQRYPPSVFSTLFPRPFPPSHRNSLCAGRSVLLITVVASLKCVFVLTGGFSVQRWSTADDTRNIPYSGSSVLALFHSPPLMLLLPLCAASIGLECPPNVSPSFTPRCAFHRVMSPPCFPQECTGLPQQCPQEFAHFLTVVLYVRTSFF